MPNRSRAGGNALAEFCQDLHRLRDQASGPSVRQLAASVGLGKSQVAAILNGEVRRPPQWRVVRGMVEACYKFAHDHGREQYLSIRAGLDEYWRPRHAMLEHGVGQSEKPIDEDETVPRQLPPASPHFVGRTRELAGLRRAPDGPVLIVGMAGVGKTALALAWAHEVASHYPGGQLYLNLRAFDPSRPAVTPPQAVRALLEVLGVTAQRLPRGFEAQVGLCRTMLSERRMLLLLDDALDADQVRPLLPPSPASRAIVTSRVELAELVALDGAHLVPLEVLPDNDSRRFLARRLGGDRVKQEPDAVDRLLQLCGRLPIALAVTAARAATRPHFPLAAIVEEAGNRGEPDVEAIFFGSYQALSAPAARLFGLLGVSAGPDIGIAAAASLAGIDEASAGHLLAELARAHLATEPAPNRFGMHDLLRTYAIKVSGHQPDREAARRRYADHYLHTAHRAAILFGPHRAMIPVEPLSPGVRPEQLDDLEQALAWFRRERAVVVCLADFLGTQKMAPLVWQLGFMLSDFLELGGHSDDWLAVQTRAVAAARQGAPPDILARSLHLLGGAHSMLGQFEQARQCFGETAELFRAAGEVAWQARILTNISHTYEREGRYDQALECARQALDLVRGGGNPAATARAHNSVGWCFSLLGDHEQAVDHCQRALALYREIGNAHGQAASWDSLGRARHGLGHHDEAIRCYRFAVPLLRETGDRYNEAGTLDHLAQTYVAVGDTTAAREAWEAALAIFLELDQPEADAMRARLDALEPGRHSR